MIDRKLISAIKSTLPPMWDDERFTMSGPVKHIDPALAPPVPVEGPKKIISLLGKMPKRKRPRPSLAQINCIPCRTKRTSSHNWKEKGVFDGRQRFICANCQKVAYGPKESK